VHRLVVRDLQRGCLGAGLGRHHARRQWRRCAIRDVMQRRRGPHDRRGARRRDRRDVWRSGTWCRIALRDIEGGAGGAGEDGGECELEHRGRSFGRRRRRRGGGDMARGHDRERRQHARAQRARRRSRAGAQRPRDQLVDAARQQGPAPRQPLHHGGLAQPEHLGDVPRRLAVLVVQHQHLAEGLGHLAQGAPHGGLGLRRRDLGERIAVGRRVLRRGVERELARAPAPGLAAEVARDATQPRAEARWIAQRAEPVPGGDERVLRDVVGQRAAAGGAQRDRGDRTLVALDQLAKRRAFAASAGLDQPGVARGALGRARVHVVLVCREPGRT
jgi:hypothetical protein